MRARTDAFRSTIRPQALEVHGGPILTPACKLLRSMRDVGVLILV